ncbi:hypothetical protein RJT34_27674 [Clitoria ternatea]|uniref:Transmembrane protein n=1 Tax=Clitoria ternatea TaxID=43366 RepID=A0AAN9F835_CLITE
MGHDVPRIIDVFRRSICLQSSKTGSSRNPSKINLGDMLVKVGVFIVVQVLVYIIISNSSNVFSKNMKKTNSFRPARSVSIRRMLALISDFPPEVEPSPSPKGPQSPILKAD